MQEVDKIKNLEKYVMYFAGKTLQESLKLSDDWAKLHKVELINYYVQLSSKTSIIVGYRKKESVE